VKWPIKTLAELAAPESNSFVDGPFGSNLKASEYQDAGVPIVRLQNVRPNLFLHKDIKFISDRKAASLKRHDFRTGDLVIAKLGDPCAVACIVPDGFPDGRLVADVVRFRGKPDVVDHRYVAYFLNAPAAKAQVDAGTTGTTRKRVNLTRLKALVLPLPPLAEQRRIAEVLDRAEALRAKRRAALAQLDSLTQSLFLDLFGDPATNPKGWPRVPFRDLLENIDSGWSPKCLDRPVTGKEWGILKLGAVTWCEYDPMENKALPPDVEPDAAIEVKRGDLLFARKNTYELVAACALVRETPPRLLMSDLIFRLRLRPDAKVDSCFLHQLLIYPTKRRDIQKLAGGSAGSMPNISKARLETTAIEVPPIPLQREFARRVTAVEALKTAQRASLAELDALFATLQHRAFRGEL